MSKKWPKISIVIPTLNQGKYIEKTITSVLEQDYPNLEYLIMDGGSTDGTLKILKKYENRLNWYSGKDRGQSDAINKGLKKTSGEILAFLNSDDYYERNTLLKVGKFFQDHPHAMWVTGKCRIVNAQGVETRRVITAYKNFILKYLRYRNILHTINFISQPATFWRREAIDKIGFFDTSLNYSMDYDYWIRLIEKYNLFFIDQYLAIYRVHKAAKAVISPQSQFEAEYKIIKRYCKSNPILLLHKIHASCATLLYRKFFSNINFM